MKKFKQRTRGNAEGENLGRNFELRVERILIQMKKDEKIKEWNRFKPNGILDELGLDFRVKDHHKELYFGITISKRRFERAKEIHPDSVTIKFLLDETDQNISFKILRSLSIHGKLNELTT